MPHAIRHLFHINAKRSSVYAFLTSIDGLSRWWTEQTTGTANVGGVIKFRFGEAGCDMKVQSLTQDLSVTWECVAGFPDWIGTDISIRLDEHEGKTRVRFEHSNWKEQNEFFAACSFSWGRYMESLRQLCEHGAGNPFGSDGGGNAAAIVEKYHKAIGESDFATLRSLLADHLDFQGPIATHTTPDGLINDLRGLARIVKGMTVKRIFPDGVDICVIYDLLTDMGVSPVAEWFHVDNSRIDRIRVFFDARPFAAMFANKS